MFSPFVESTRHTMLTRAAMASLGVFAGACGGQSDGQAVTPDTRTHLNPGNHPCAIGECIDVPGRTTVAPRPFCPTDEPAVDEPCDSSPSMVCSYGESLTSFCRARYACQNRRWAVVGQQTCAEIPADHCPSQPAPAAPCTTPPGGAFFPCEYSGGIGCYCVPWSSFGLEAPDQPGAWECYGPPSNADCPERLPNVGEGCEVIEQYCRYGVAQEGCYAPYASVYCYGGAWEMAEAGCLG
jgi:hypothetical protein